MVVVKMVAIRQKCVLLETTVPSVLYDNAYSSCHHCKMMSHTPSQPNKIKNKDLHLEFNSRHLKVTNVSLLQT